MTEVVYASPDALTLMAVASKVGWYDAKIQQIVSSAPIASGGSWFFNHVGVVQVPTGRTITDRMGNPQPEMVPDPHLWGRLRVNGDASALPEIIAACRTAGVLIYELFRLDGQTEFWSADGGITPAPDWVQGVAVIA